MEYRTIHHAETGTTTQFSTFTPESGLAEYHVMIQLEQREDTFSEQLERILRTEASLSAIPQFERAKPVFKRYFLSDSTNQQALIEARLAQLAMPPCTVSYIQQPPLSGTKLAVWIYLVGSQSEVVYQADSMGSTLMLHNGYAHLWTMGLFSNKGTSYEQTETLLLRYEEQLRERWGSTLAANCIRTWFFVRDVDTQYKGLVVARRENFTRQGLTPQTHYIASTGIGGNPADPAAIIQMGCYALLGFEPSQQRYLYAPTHLNKTYEYGVTFERGTLLEYGDRGHIFISGTASINNRGEVMHVGDIRRQTLRMWENVEQLLAEGGMTYDNVMQIVVYLRDSADYPLVRRLFRERFPNTPHVITLAPVCRPTWLIEMECIAVSPRHTTFRPF